MERFSGFYTSRPFWAGKKLDFPYHGRVAPQTFHDMMSTLEYEKHENDITLRVYKDGQILLRIQSLEDQEEKHRDKNTIDIAQLIARAKIYINYLNCFYLFLDSATITIDKFSYFNFREITTHDIFRISFTQGKFSSNGIPTESITSHFLNGRYLSDYNHPHSLESDSRITFRSEISLEAIDCAATKLFDVFSKDGSIRHFTSIAKSIGEYKIGNYDTSIILAWFAIESIINELWENHIGSLNTTSMNHRPRISSERKKALTGSSFEASKIIQMLELFGILSFDTFEKLKTVRQNRNNIAHIQKIALTAEKAGEAISAAQEMIFLLWGIEFTPNLNYSISN